MLFLKSFLILITITIFFVTADNKILVIQHKTRFSTLAEKYYYDRYYGALLKKFNNKNGEFLNQGDSVIIPDIDSLLLKSEFKEEFELLYKASSFQTSMYTYQYDLNKLGIDSLSKKAKKGAKLIFRAIKGIKSKCDSLHYSYPKGAISQLNSAADGLLQYQNYLQGGDIYATKNIYVENQHLRLWKLYVALWLINGHQ